MLNHNQHENSNLIMPFLVQNDNNKMKGQTTLMREGDLKNKLFFFEKCSPYTSNT